MNSPICLPAMHSLQYLFSSAHSCSPNDSKLAPALARTHPGQFHRALLPIWHLNVPPRSFKVSTHSIFSHTLWLPPSSIQAIRFITIAFYLGPLTPAIAPSYHFPFTQLLTTDTLCLPVHSFHGISNRYPEMTEIMTT